MMNTVATANNVSAKRASFSPQPSTAGQASWQLNVIAPNFDPDLGGGAGEAMVALTSRFIRIHPKVRIYLNQRVAKRFPDWKANVVEVATWRMQGNATKAAAMLKLGLFGSSSLPEDGVSWFPFGAMIPFSFNGRGVATIYDTLDRDYPKRVRLLDRLFRRVMMPRTVRRCAVVTSSRFSQNCLRRHLGVDANLIRLAAVPLPPPCPIRLPPRPYVFYPANAWSHKNHEFLLRTWQTDRRLRDIALVFTLGSGPGDLGPLISQARSGGIKIHVTGRLTRSELATYYQSALCSVLPSVYEGFGLTVQESINANCPVLINRDTAASETVAADYPFVLPLDEERWAATILALGSGPPQDMTRWANSSTWDEVAAEYLALFQNLYAK